MSDNINPFAGLLTNDTDETSVSSLSVIKQQPDIKSSMLDSNNEEKQSTVTIIIEDIFGIYLETIDSLKNINKNLKQLVKIDAETIEDGIFERLTLTDIGSKLYPPLGSKNINCDSHYLQSDVVPYLFESWCRLQKYKNDIAIINDVDRIEKVIERSIITALEEPEIYCQNIHKQYLELFCDPIEISNNLIKFTENIIKQIQYDYQTTPDEQYKQIKKLFTPIFLIIQHEASTSNLLLFSRYRLTALQIFTGINELGILLMDLCTPNESTKIGSAYSNTILGSILSLSCLPKSIGSPYDFFDKILTQQNSSIEGNIWSALDNLTESLYKVFHSLLKCSNDTRHMTLTWIGKCLEANSSRGKLWNSQSGMDTTVSDGFMLNLSNILLRLCQPFSKYSDEKILKVDPTYCAAIPIDSNDAKTRGIHIIGLDKETCLVPVINDDNTTKIVSKNFNFITECFFLTHRSLDLGYRIVIDKLIKTNQDLNRIQQVYNDAQNGGSSEVFDVITQRMEMEMTKYLSLRASLLSPCMLTMLTKFHSATAYWLMQVNINNDLNNNNIDNINNDDDLSYAPKKHKNLTFPLTDNIPETLSCIPEFIVENTIGFICFLKRLNPNTFEEHGFDFLNPILSEIIGLMESSKRLYNPHLRAQLAEGLEALLPIIDDGNNTSGQRLQTLGTFHRQQLFINHQHRKYIVNNLLEVFVSIEMTGQSVQFEQKFNYRRPMYIVMDYLWKINEHKNYFKILADDAEENMDAVQPPLFLKFINLLMNDAVFLLDEALTNMAQLKQMLTARENGDWEKLPQNERDQQTRNLQHVGMIAKFDNILGRETISTLKMLTTYIKSIFCHSTMVDRIASMLNYLLLQLVGPNKRNLKVKDQKEYEFNPGNLVLNICEIYINLGENDKFTLAVSQDGRSYRSDLFKLADNVLMRIGGGAILTDLECFSKRVEEAGNIKRVEEEIFSDAPDEFLDPIMSTLMIDPVFLPSSKISVDRQTIAR